MFYLPRPLKTGDIVHMVYELTCVCCFSYHRYETRGKTLFNLVNHAQMTNFSFNKL